MPNNWAMAKPSGGSSDWEGRPSESGVSVFLGRHFRRHIAETCLLKLAQFKVDVVGFFVKLGVSIHGRAAFA